MMKIYLMQHGQPTSKEEDPDRPLSENGRKDVEKTAIFLQKFGIVPESIFHSGKTRARQTAEIMALRLNPAKEPIEKGGLAPVDDPKTFQGEIEKAQKDLMVVGHLPHLGRLASLLCAGTASDSIVAFQQGSVVCLEKSGEGEGWSLSWMLTPKIIPV